MLLNEEARSWLGRVYEAPPYQVTATDIARFAHSIGATDLVHFDDAEARRRGHPAIVAPLGYYLVVRHAGPNLMPMSELTQDGGSNDLTPPNGATRRMAGDCRTRFHRQIHAGDVISLRKTIMGMEEKQGRSGALAFITYELEFRDAQGRPVVDETYVRILR